MKQAAPLFAVLCLCLCSSCSEQPLEPSAAESANSSPLFSPGEHQKGGSNDYSWDAYVPCADEWVHFTARFTWELKRHYDANGGLHVTYKWRKHGTGIGEHGSEWIANDVGRNGNFISPDDTHPWPRVYNQTFSSVWIGKGKAPNWRVWWVNKITDNANGETKADLWKYREECF